MDFNFSDDQKAIRELAYQIFTDRASDEFLLAFSRTDETYDETLWQTLAEQGLLGVAIPEAAGGTGLGLVELCLVLEEQGRRVAPVPLYASLVLGGLPIVAVRVAGAAAALSAGAGVRRRQIQCRHCRTWHESCRCHHSDGNAGEGRLGTVRRQGGGSRWRGGGFYPGARRGCRRTTNRLHHRHPHAGRECAARGDRPVRVPRRQPDAGQCHRRRRYACWVPPDRAQTSWSGWSSAPISATARCRSASPKRP